MTRLQLEHIIRAATQIADDNELVIVGSQAILGAFPDAPESLCVSVEADVYPRTCPERADLIDGTIGEGSPFHETFGYYAQGVGVRTAVLAPGWEARLIAVSNPNTRGAIGWCLDPRDIVLSKLVAGREKDLRYAREALRHGLVLEVDLLALSTGLPIEDAVMSLVRGRIGRLTQESRS